MRLVRMNGSYFFFNDTATTEIYTLSLHDALPIYSDGSGAEPLTLTANGAGGAISFAASSQILGGTGSGSDVTRSEEHTSELQSRQYLVCRLLLEKKNKTTITSMLYLHSFAYSLTS